MVVEDVSKIMKVVGASIPVDVVDGKVLELARPFQELVETRERFLACVDAQVGDGRCAL